MTDNKDLTENRIPQGLLYPEERKRMEAWEHGWTYFEWDTDEWVRLPEGHALCGTRIHRAIPERETVWANVYPNVVGHVFIDAYDSREVADSATSADGRIAVWRITYDKGTLANPVIEVEDL